MSSNLVGGFHNRLEGSRKYLFGSAAVYGKANDSLISGVYMLRGSSESIEPIDLPLKLTDACAKLFQTPLTFSMSPLITSLTLTLPSTLPPTESSSRTPGLGLER